MSDNQQSRIVGFGFLLFFSVIIWEPLITSMNENIGSGFVADALSSFFWIVYALVVLFLVYKTLISLFR